MISAVHEWIVTYLPLQRSSSIHTQKAYTDALADVYKRQAVNPVAETSPVEQPAVHPETDVRLLDLNKIVNSTYNPRKNFREDTLLELAESIKQSGRCV